MKVPVTDWKTCRTCERRSSALFALHTQIVDSTYRILSLLLHFHRHIIVSLERHKVGELSLPHERVNFMFLPLSYLVFFWCVVNPTLYFRCERIVRVMSKQQKSLWHGNISLTIMGHFHTVSYHGAEVLPCQASSSSCFGLCLSKDARRPPTGVSNALFM